MKFFIKLGDLDSEARVNTLANRLPNVNRETLLARLSNAKSKTLMAVLSDIITELQNETLSQRLGNV